MDEEIKKMLGEEIKMEINDLSTLTPGSKEKSTAIEDLAKLYKLRIEEIKNEWDVEEKYNRRIMESKHHESEVENHELELQLKNDQSKEQNRDRYIRLGVDIAGIILPLIFYATWMRKGFKFEETGTYTSTTFRGLFTRFKPTNKIN